MPKIPVIQRQFSPNAGSPNALADMRSAGVVGEAIQRAGHVGQQIAGQVAERAEQMRRQDIDKAVLNTISAIDTELYEIKGRYLSERGEDAKDSLPRFNDDFKALADKHLKGDYDAEYKNKVISYLVSKKGQVEGVLTTHEVNQREVATVNAVDRSVEVQRKAAFEGKEGLFPALKNIENSIRLMRDNGSLSETGAEDALMKAQSLITESFLEGTITREPGMAASLIKSGMLNQYLNSDKLNEFHTKANMIIERQKAEAKAAASGSQNDKNVEAGYGRRIILGTGENKSIALPTDTEIFDDPNLSYPVKLQLIALKGARLKKEGGEEPIAKKTRTQQEGRVYSELKKLHKDGLLGEKIEGQKKLSELENLFTEWRIQNPDADPADFLERVVKPTKLEGYERFFSVFFDRSDSRAMSDIEENMRAIKGDVGKKEPAKARESTDASFEKWLNANWEKVRKAEKNKKFTDEQLRDAMRKAYDAKR